MSAAAAVRALAPLVDAIAKTRKKKSSGPAKKKKKGKAPANSPLEFSQKAVTMSAPSTGGRASRNTRSSNVLEVPFSSPILQVSCTTGTSTMGLVVPGSIATVGSPIVGISGAVGSVSNYPQCLPNTIIRLIQSFARYRIKPGSARLTYSTIVNSGVSGTIAFSVLPADAVSGTTPTFQTAGSAECSMTVPVWTPSYSIDKARLQSVIGTEWKYCDFDGTVTQSEIRQDTLFRVASAGLGLTAATTYGVLTLSAVFQFSHLVDNLVATGASISTGGPSSSTATAASSLSPSRAPRQEQNEHQEELGGDGDFVDVQNSERTGHIRVPRDIYEALQLRLATQGKTL